MLKKFTEKQRQQYTPAFSQIKKVSDVLMLSLALFALGNIKWSFVDKEVVVIALIIVFVSYWPIIIWEIKDGFLIPRNSFFVLPSAYRQTAVSRERNPLAFRISIILKVFVFTAVPIFSIYYYLLSH